MRNNSIIHQIHNGKFLTGSPGPFDIKCNSNGYRAPEFDTVDWANSVVIFGCSLVLGVGVEDEHTLSSQLSQLIGMPVINMGAGGTSMQFSFYNSIILNNNYPTPKAVIHAWTALERTSYYLQDQIQHHGAWDINDKQTTAYNQDETHPAVHALFYQMISKQIWSHKTTYYETSFFKHTSSLLSLPVPRSYIDLAKDNMHPGPKSLYNMAIKIKENINI